VWQWQQVGMVRVMAGVMMEMAGAAMAYVAESLLLATIKVFLANTW
jgi:hypothetical protein